MTPLNTIIEEEIQDGDVLICDGTYTGKVGKIIGVGSSEHSIKLLVDGTERYEPDYCLLRVTKDNKKSVVLLILHLTAIQRAYEAGREEALQDKK